MVTHNTGLRVFADRGARETLMGGYGKTPGSPRNTPLRKRRCWTISIVPGLYGVTVGLRPITKHIAKSDPYGNFVKRCSEAV